MRTLKFETEQEWLDARTGRITGTRVGSLLSKRDKKPLKGYYELIAERIAIPHDGENVLDRGHRLEEEAVKRFTEETGKKVDTSLVLWVREDNEDIAVSPDGFIGEKEAVECKCLNSASHIEAFLTKQVPNEYETQILQYFIVNDKLETLYFCFYDPRMPKDFFYLTVSRKDVQDKIDEYFEMEKRVLKEVEEISKQLTF